MKNAPNARIIYDKFHIMRHLFGHLDEVSREYQRRPGPELYQITALYAASPLGEELAAKLPAYVLKESVHGGVSL